MVKVFSNEHTFSHPFSRVTSAFWRKYPNELAPHVKAIDCFDRKLVRLGPNALSTAAAAGTSTDAAASNAAIPVVALALSSSPSPSSSSSSSSSSASSSRSPSNTTTSPSSTVCLVTNRVISVESSIPSWLQSLGVSNHAYAIETTIVNPATQQMLVKSRNITGSQLMTVEESCFYEASRTNPEHTYYRQDAKITAFLPMFSTRFEQFTLQNVRSKSQHGLRTIETLCERIQNNGVLSLLEDLMPHSTHADVSAAVATASAVN